VRIVRAAHLVRPRASGDGRHGRPQSRLVVLALVGTLAGTIVGGCSFATGAPIGAGTRVDGAATSPSPVPAALVPAASPTPSESPDGSPAPPGAPGATASPGPVPGPQVEPGPAWTTRSLALLTRAGDDRSVAAHVGKAFPLELTSRQRAVGVDLWVEARWETPGRIGTAWVPLAAVARTDPQRTPAASLDALDADLYRYLRSFGTRVGVEVWDRTRGMIYTHNAGRQYLVASSIKVELLCAFLAKLEKAGREPTTRERSLLAAMIKRSDNNAAGYFYDALGEAPGVTAYMKRIGVSGLIASPAWRGWGWSTITPAAQVRVFDLLRQGKLLNAKHTKYALGLLRTVIPEHRTGVGTTAPKGADVAMKVGWVTGPDDRWVMNSSGIVTYEGVTYVIAVYTDRNATLEEGVEIVERACGAIAEALLGRD
jgi:beta-lactamase class A